jgi:hypothetical protein
VAVKLLRGRDCHAVPERLKQTGARSRARHAEQMVALCGLLYSDLWDTFWEPRNN